MFVGHYAASLALKSVEKKASLGLLFLAVQFVDILFFPFVLLGIERINVVDNYTQSTHFELEYMPFTHSLLASFLCAGFIYVVYRIVPPRNKSVVLVMSIAVLSQHTHSKRRSWPWGSGSTCALPQQLHQSGDTAWASSS